MNELNIESIIAWSQEAGSEIEKIRKGKIKSRKKKDGSPVTEADLAAHEILTEYFRTSDNSAPVISEENWEEGTSLPENCDSYWLIDPLDGTKEFIQDLPEFTVNIAFIHQGQPILGVIYLPAAGTTYYGTIEDGAFKLTADGHKQKLSPSAQQVEEKHQPNAVVSRSHVTPETHEFLQRLGIQQVIGRGSSLKMCAVAEGTASIYPRLGPTCYWDTAAGSAIALSAHCLVIDLEGRPLCYSLADGIKHPGFIVYNPDEIDPVL